MSSRRLYVLLTSTLGAFVLTSGAQDASSEASPPVTDYGSAFETFHKLGLPRVPADATLVILHAKRPYRIHTYNPAMQGQLSNCAWMLPGKGPSRSFVTVSGRRVQVVDRETYMKKRQEETAEVDPMVMHAHMETGAFSEDGELIGSWQEADAAEKLDELIAALAPDTDTEEGQQQLRQIERYLSGGHASAGPVMIAAVGFYNKGFKQEANRIVARLFELAKDKRKVIIQTMSAIADSRLEAATESFAQTRDWQAYRDAVAAIRKQTASGWEKAPGAELLIKKLDERIAGDAPVIEGEHLTDLDRQYAEELADADLGQVGMQQLMRRQMMGGFLNPTFCRDVFASTNATVLSKLTARGPEGIPLLAALLDDTYLTPVMSTEASQLGMHQYGMGHFSSFSGRGSRQPSAETIYAQIPHPLSRGELAKPALMQLVAVDDQTMGRLAQMSAEEIRVLALDFHAKSQGKSPRELAEMYLKEGGSMQRNVVLQALQAADSPEVHEMLKNYILNEGEPMQMMGIVMQYARRQGADAAPVVEAFLKKYQKAIDQQLKQNPRMRGVMPNYEQQIEGLKAMVSGGDLAGLLADLDVERYMHQAGAIQQQVNQMPVKEAMETLLDAAIAAQEPFQRAMIMGITQMLAMRGQMRAYTGGGTGDFDAEAFNDSDFYKTVVNTPKGSVSAAEAAEEKESADTLDLQMFRKQCETLLADEREFENPMAQMYQPGIQGPQRVCDSVAWCLAMLALGQDEPRAGMSIYQLHTLGDRIHPLLHKVARAGIEGRKGDELPSLPSAADVDKEVLDKLVAQMEALSAEEAKAFLEKRSLSELLALQQRLAAESELNSKISTFANRITAVDIDDAFAEAAAGLSSFRGSVVSSNLLTNAIAVCRRLVADGTQASISVVRKPWLEGAVLGCSSLDEEQAAQQTMYRQMMMGGMFGEVQDEEQRLVTATISGGGVHGNARWKVDAPAAEAADKSAANNAKLKFLKEMGVEMQGKISAAQMSQMMEAMGEMSKHLDQQMAREQKQFWESLETFNEGKRAVLQGATITVSGVIVKPEGDEDETEE